MKNLVFAKYLSIALLIALGIGWIASSPSKSDTAEMLEDALQRTVIVRAYYLVEGSTKPSTGHGAVVSPSGRVLTAAHIFSAAPKYKFAEVEFLNGTVREAKIINLENSKDLALLQIVRPGRYKHMKLAKAGSYFPGDTVYAIGTPLRLAFTVTHGIVSKLSSPIGQYVMTQSDAFLSPGSSGGPLINTKGELIGINAQIYSQQPPLFGGFGFSAPVETIHDYLDMYEGIGE